jgi:hypothetical protein
MSKTHNARRLARSLELLRAVNDWRLLRAETAAHPDVLLYSEQALAQHDYDCRNGTRAEQLLIFDVLRKA